MSTVHQVVIAPTPVLATTSTQTPTSVRPRSVNGGLREELENDGLKKDGLGEGLKDVEMEMYGGDARPTTLENGARFGSGPQRGDSRIVAIVYGQGQESILSVFAEVLGQPFRLRARFGDVTAGDAGAVVGIAAVGAGDVASRDSGLVVAINAHCVGLGMPPDARLSASCDYEFLYTNTPYLRRDLARFVSFTLGQINHHETLMAKQRTFIISTTFPDVRAALPNIDILTVGADAVELRVDLLREPLADGSGGFAAVPSLSYVGEQVMLLRQRTELPIIFTTRCTHENGRFPMEDPALQQAYLRRAIQWGIEYLDVEVWLPETIRRALYEARGSSRIMSAFHDFSGTFRWPSDRARAVFVESSRLADIVKMIAIINDHEENFELEYFRLRMRSEFPHSPPLSAVNMGETGQVSRTLNRVFTPITHPLLPLIAAPGQMSAAEINAALAMVGQLPKKNMYGISGSSSRAATPQASFYEKCFNELGLPHHFAVIERPAIPPHYRRSGVGSPPHLSPPPLSHPGHSSPHPPADGSGTPVDAWCNQKHFGGAYLTPPMSIQGLVAGSTFFQSLNGGTGPILTEAARLIGMVDTIFVRNGSPATSPSSMPSSPRPSFHNQNGRQSQQQQHQQRPLTPAHAGLPANTTLVFDNAAWRGILSTLTRDLAPSAYFDRTAVVLAGSADDAASAVFALRELRVGKLFTVGFKTPTALARGLDVEPFNSLESLQRARASSSSTSTAAGRRGDVDGDGSAPFVVVSALGPDKANLVSMLLRLFGSSPSTTMREQPRRKKVFLDLAELLGSSSASASTPPPPPGSSARRTDPAIVAEQAGFRAYGAADAAAFTTVETLRLLVGQNVPYSFVRLASGRTLY